jgi:hypothetical protein
VSGSGMNGNHNGSASARSGNASARSGNHNASPRSGSGSGSGNESSSSGSGTESSSSTSGNESSASGNRSGNESSNESTSSDITAGRIFIPSRYRVTKRSGLILRIEDPEDMGDEGLVFDGSYGTLNFEIRETIQSTDYSISITS